MAVIQESPEKKPKRWLGKTSVPGRKGTWPVGNGWEDHRTSTSSLGRKCSGEGQACSPEPSSYPKCPCYEPPWPDQLPEPGLPARTPAPGPGLKLLEEEHGPALRHVSFRCRAWCSGVRTPPSASLGLLSPLNAQRPWSSLLLRKALRQRPCRWKPFAIFSLLLCNTGFGGQN